jgi:muramoyltetrapeptide carboxypeptidase
VLTDRIPKSARPSNLTAGDRVGIVWPSGPASPERADKGLACVRAMGLEPVLFPSDGGSHGFLAGSDASRARALEQAFADPTLSAVWCMRGGYGCIRTLEHVRLDRFSGSDKVLIGFSDITALLLNVGVSVIHGPVVTQTADLNPEALAHLQGVLMGDIGAVALDPDARVLRPGAIEGPLMAGNLSVMASLVGTGWLPSFEGAVLVLEDVGEPTYRIDRMLTQLILSDALFGVAGLVIGRFSGVTIDPDELDEVIIGAARALEVPVVRGIAVGHTADNRALPLGRPCVVTDDAIRWS